MELKLPKIDLDFLKQKKKPLHIAIDGHDLKGWNNGKEDELINKNIEQIKLFCKYQIKNKVPILTLNISSETDDEVNSLVKFFKELINNPDIRENNVRVFIIGSWYDLDQELTDLFKQIMDQTKDNDDLFLNFCVQYDGQEEVLSVIKLLAKKVIMGKMKFEDIDKQTVKENLYTSYFSPPEVIIEPSKIYAGLLLWDAKGSKIYQTRKHWLDLTDSDLDSAITWANRE